MKNFFLSSTFLFLFIATPSVSSALSFTPSPTCQVEGRIKAVSFASQDLSWLQVGGGIIPDRFILNIIVNKTSTVKSVTPATPTCVELYPIGSEVNLKIADAEVPIKDELKIGSYIAGTVSRQFSDGYYFENYSVETPSSYQFTRNLSLGMSGEDVRQLQIRLNAEGFKVAETGPGSPGQETVFFGSRTRQAVIRYLSSGLCLSAYYLAHNHYC